MIIFKEMIIKEIGNLLFLISGIALVLAISDLPNWYYESLRYIVCAVCIYGAYLNNKSKNIKWTCIFVVSGLVYNPFIRVGLVKGHWELINLILATCFFIAFFNGSMGKRLWITSKITIWCLFLFVMGFTVYVNYFLPHGEQYETGEVVCANDERGPCGPEIKEDLRNLNIPRWAKVLRKDGVAFLMMLSFIGVLLSSKNLEKDELEFKE